VYNYALEGSIDGKPENDENGTVLCARQTNASCPAQIINAPCFLPNSLAGDYWVIAAGACVCTWMGVWMVSWVWVGGGGVGCGVVVAPNRRVRTMWAWCGVVLSGVVWGGLGSSCA
jgi:hypothetical protein